MSWVTLSSERIFDRPWLHVRREKVKLPTGAIHDEYYVLDYPTWINVIAITDDDRFVLVRQYRHGLGVTSMELVAGCVEEGEDPMAGAKRELEEETGFTGGQWEELCVLSPNPSANSNLCHCYIARGVKQTSGQHLDTTEDIEIHLLTREELFDLLSSGQIIQAMMAAPLWKFFYQTRR